MLNLKRTVLLVTAVMIAWPILDGCWRGFFGSSDWKNDALLHSITITTFVLLFFLFPALRRRLNAYPR
jgi:hypothetical protein